MWVANVFSSLYISYNYNLNGNAVLLDIALNVPEYDHTIHIAYPSFIIIILRIYVVHAWIG